MINLTQMKNMSLLEKKDALINGAGMLIKKLLNNTGQKHPTRAHSQL